MVGIERPVKRERERERERDVCDLQRQFSDLSTTISCLFYVYHIHDEDGEREKERELWMHKSKINGFLI